ncbi:MAG TPA: tRNA (adenosine(37)-N6)-dimethylallyltransferase MiaA [Spirochaetia bacterium]|nr:tRNA (adenosine(37)-N6)-dimethylallyltransferase MiaA [Spirochaetia bacterium]
MTDRVPSIVILFGPTAVGKSEILTQLFDQRFEVINADSMQVYRHMDIGTAKPGIAARERPPLHLIDVAEPSYQWNAGEFVKSAETLVEQIRARDKVPVVCGGTAFYITSFLYGLPESPKGDAEARARLKEIARVEGRDALARLLRERDPVAASRIPEGDTYRITRALEVLESTGESLYSFQWPRALRAGFRFLLLGLQRDREDLYRRIEQRVDRMFSQGLVDEVKNLLSLGYGPDDPGMRGIGYREILQMRTGCQSLTGARELIKRNSRRYAKRQLTFFRSVEGVGWFAPTDVLRMQEAIDEFLAVANGAPEQPATQQPAT